MKEHTMTCRLPDHPPYPCRIAGDAVRATLCELLGVRDPAETPEYTLEGDEQSNGLRIRHVRFANMLGEEGPGVLIVPTMGTAGGVPAVVCTPGTAHAVCPAYAQAGVAGAFTLYQPDSRHEFSVASFSVAARWLQDHL